MAYKIYKGSTEIKKIINSNSIKYYKYTSWTQPINPTGISATSGWSNPNNAFDGNLSTYASCGTKTDYIEYTLPNEIELSGVSAKGQYVASVARYCNISVYSVDNSGKETLLGNGSGGGESDTYTSSTTFPAVWVKRIRIKLIKGSGDPTTEYPTRIREITLTASRQKVQGNKDDYDVIDYNPIKKVYKGSTLIYNAFEAPKIDQPTFTSNTTNGITVSIQRGAGDAYVLFNGTNSHYYMGRSWVDNWAQIKYPQQVVLDKYAVTTDNYGSYPNKPYEWYLQGSNNGTSWTNIHHITDQTYQGKGVRTEYPVDMPEDTKYYYYRLLFKDGKIWNSAGELNRLQFYTKAVG